MFFLGRLSRLSSTAMMKRVTTAAMSSVTPVRHHSNEEHLSEAEQELQNKIKSAHREMTSQVLNTIYHIPTHAITGQNNY